MGVSGEERTQISQYSNRNTQNSECMKLRDPGLAVDAVLHYLGWPGWDPDTAVCRLHEVTTTHHMSLRLLT